MVFRRRIFGYFRESTNSDIEKGPRNYGLVWTLASLAINQYNLFDFERSLLFSLYYSNIPQSFTQSEVCAPYI